MMSSAATASATSTLRRRAHPRFPLRSLAYVRLEHNNGGVIRDLTQSGIALQADTQLHAGDEVTLRFDLFFPRVRIEAHGWVAWADDSGQAGICFAGLPQRSQRAVRDWVFTQMLSAAAVSGRDSMFDALDAQLVLSSAARQPILVPALPQPQLGTVRWGVLSLSVRSFSIFVDSVILLCAVLFFSTSSLAVMGAVPPLPLAATLLLATSTIFVAVYHLIFSDFLCGASPGKRLAAIAAGLPGDDVPVTRFR
jgi:hypothetical protein